MLIVEGISKTYARKKSLFNDKDTEKYYALNNISFELNKGDCIGILGANGSGKSTLLKALFGSIYYEKGIISFKNKKVKKNEGLKNESSLFHNNDRSFFWRLTVKQNLEYFRNLQNKESNKVIFDNASSILDIEDLLNRQFMSLSSGQRKKVALFRGLARDPEILFFDEFTESLDLENQIKFESLIKEKIIKECSKTVLWVTHSLDEVRNLCNKVIILRNGEIDFENYEFDGSDEEMKELKNKLLL